MSEKVAFGNSKDESILPIPDKLCKNSVCPNCYTEGYHFGVLRVVRVLRGCGFPENHPIFEILVRVVALPITREEVTEARRYAMDMLEESVPDDAAVVDAFLKSLQEDNNE